MKKLNIETDRLIITTFDESMAEKVHLNSLDEYTRKFLPDEVFETVDEARESIAWLMNCYKSEKNEPLVYPIILKNGDNIGYVQAVPLNDNEWEVGYHIAEQYTSNGYATEAVISFIPEIIKKKKKKSIWGICRGDNIASRKVLEKCSFVLKHKGVEDYKGEQHKVCRYLLSI